MFERILLLPVSDDPAQPAAERAVELAAPRARIEVFRPVYEPALEGYMGRADVHEPLRRRVLEERLASAQKIAAALARPGLECTANAVWDRAFEHAVARETVAGDIDLVVTAPSGGGWTQRDWRVLSMCPSPVLVAKTPASRAYRQVVAAVDPMHAHAKPAALDAAILGHAKKLAHRFGARLRVVHCFTPLSDLALRSAEHVPLDDAEMALEEARRRALDALLAEAGITVGSAELVPGRPADALETLAASGAADLIVMGGVARGRLRDFLIGSTAERVLEASDVDVLVVKPPGFPSPADRPSP